MSACWQPLGTAGSSRQIVCQPSEPMQMSGTDDRRSITSACWASIVGSTIMHSTLGIQFPGISQPGILVLVILIWMWG